MFLWWKHAMKELILKMTVKMKATWSLCRTKTVYKILYHFESDFGSARMQDVWSFYALFSGLCICHWQIIPVWTPQLLSQPCFVCWTGYNGLPVAVEPLPPLHQSEPNTDQHRVQHNVGPSPCSQRTSVNRRENRDCLDERGDVNLQI